MYGVSFIVLVFYVFRIFICYFFIFMINESVFVGNMFGEVVYYNNVYREIYFFEIGCIYYLWSLSVVLKLIFLDLFNVKCNFLFFKIKGWKLFV